ncbi:MAG: LacI family DNA-binding transcriptional regulator, partial [Kiritimatiellae bacterium]|nr:LacI family DNA-binding transcriptional regulator [Kiritimatiellia bacterium]
MTTISDSNKRTTLEDIARAVGVSRASVGKVLGANKSNIRVSVEKARVIRQMAQKMNYTPNLNARALAGQTTQVIGVLIDSKAPGVFVQRAAAIEREASRRGYRTMIGETHDNAEDFYNTYLLMRQHGVDGVLVVSHDYPRENQQIDHFFTHGGPMVFLGGPERPGHSHVILEVDSGIKLAVAHLRQRGHKNLVLMANTDSQYWSVKAREKGFLDVCPPGDSGAIVHFKQSDTMSDMRTSIRQLVRETLIPRGINAVL